VRACDLFGDEDLRDIAETRRVSPAKYPEIFAEIAEKWPSIPRVYTGGLENYPDVVERLARTGSLWGCSPESLRATRTPTALRDCGLETPASSLDGVGVPTDGSWLEKPTKGSGGRGIKPWTGAGLNGECFLQLRVEGEPVSASILALEDRALLIGAASQFIGDSRLSLRESAFVRMANDDIDASPFAYAGGMAPLTLTSQMRELLLQTGETLRRRFGLRGLFGVDGVRKGDEWSFLEINPRPTSSMELFEIAGMGSMFALHHSAFDGPSIQLRPPNCIAGKAIVYATESCRMTSQLTATIREMRFADRPVVGTEFQTGDPVATVLASGISMEEVEGNLHRGIRTIRERLLPRC